MFWSVRTTGAGDTPSDGGALADDSGAIATVGLDQSGHECPDRGGMAGMAEASRCLSGGPAVGSCWVVKGQVFQGGSKALAMVSLGAQAPVWGRTKVWN